MDFRARDIGFRPKVRLWPTSQTDARVTMNTRTSGSSSYPGGVPNAVALEFGARPYTATKPSRQLGYRSVQPSSRLAFAFDAPRASVPIMTAASPATSRAAAEMLRTRADSAGPERVNRAASDLPYA